MFIESEGIKLNVSIDLPDTPLNSADRYPVCIMIHGLTGNCEEEHILAVRDVLNDLGIAVLRADMYGHGRSGGAFKDHDINKWMANISSLIGYAKSLDITSEIYLWGHSQGGLAAILAAARYAEDIRLLMPFSPAVMIPDDARHGRLLHYKFDPDDLPDFIRFDSGAELSRNYIEKVRTVDVTEAVGSYNGNVMIVHGTADATVPYGYSELIRETYAEHGCNCTLIPIEGAPHCFDDHIEELRTAVRKYMVSFLSL